MAQRGKRWQLVGSSPCQAAKGWTRWLCGLPPGLSKPTFLGIVSPGIPPPASLPNRGPLSHGVINQGRYCSNAKANKTNRSREGPTGEISSLKSGALAVYAADKTARAGKYHAIYTGLYICQPCIHFNVSPKSPALPRVQSGLVIYLKPRSGSHLSSPKGVQGNLQRIRNLVLNATYFLFLYLGYR